MTTATSTFGAVTARTAANVRVTLEAIQRARLSVGKKNDIVHRNDSPATALILKVIESLVVNKISLY